MNDGIIEIGADGFWKERCLPAASLERTAALFESIAGETIVEIGSGLHGSKSGNSILLWAGRTSAKGIYAVDPKPQRIDEVREATAGYNAVRAVVQDGQSFMEEFQATIDLLYLDFWVEVENYRDALPKPETGAVRAEAYLRIYQASRNKLAPQSLILIDDTDHIDPWKHSSIVPAARADGFKVLWTGRQTLLARGADAGTGSRESSRSCCGGGRTPRDEDRRDTPP